MISKKVAVVKKDGGMVSNIHILIVHTTLYNIQGDFIK